MSEGAPQGGADRAGAPITESAVGKGIAPPGGRRSRWRKALRFVPGPARRAGRRVLTRGRNVARPVVGLARAVRARKRLHVSADEEAAFRTRLTATLAPSPHRRGPKVSAIVPTRDGLPHLRRLLPALEALAYEDLELVVIDNASRDGTAEFLAKASPRFPLRVIRNPVNATFSGSNNQGAAVATGELLWFLNDDVEPAGPDVLGHMVGRLIADATIGAVGTRLIYPRRPGRRYGTPDRPADLSLQHRGVTFTSDGGGIGAQNLGKGDDPLGPAATTPSDVPAATAASLLVRRTVYDEVGGFAEGYDYGAEDVDLCVRLRRAGARIVYEPGGVFWHHESATQDSEHHKQRLQRRRANWRHFQALWGPQIFREVLLDRIDARGGWSAPLHVGITLTRDSAKAGYGDWHTAHELGDALEGLGWRVTYLERWKDHWYASDPSIDVVISLLDRFDIRRLPPGVIKVAWIRNWTDRWLANPWFDDYDLVLASSAGSKALIDARHTKVAELFPIAANPARFKPPAAAVTPAYDVVSTTNRWGEIRGVELVFPRLLAAGRAVRVHGRGWDGVETMAPIVGGFAEYDDLPGIYANARIVIDDTASPTKPYGAVNSRVFDALATGTLVVTDNVEGSAELFDGLLPAADGEEALIAEVTRWLDDPVARAERAARLRELVLERHTYARRATELRALLRAWVETPRVDIAIGPPNWSVAERWGDYHFGRALQGALERRGFRTSLRLRDAWEAPGSDRADAAIQLFGLGPRRTRAGQVSVLWVISHPDLVDERLLAGQDLVFVASEPFTAELVARGATAQALHQCTDAQRFRPAEGGPHHPLLFVANSRGVKRIVVQELAGAGVDLALYGTSWDQAQLPAGVLRGDHVPNDLLPAYYAAADIVLNDTWPDMAAHGFISNRLYDAAASGAFVLSDAVEGIEREFDGGVVTFADGADLRAKVQAFLGDPDLRARHAAKARAAVLERHTVEHRADVIVAAMEPLLAQRPRRVVA